MGVGVAAGVAGNGLGAGDQVEAMDGVEERSFPHPARRVRTSAKAILEYLFTTPQIGEDRAQG